MTFWSRNIIITTEKMSKPKKSTYKIIRCLIFDMYLGNIPSAVVPPSKELLLLKIIPFYWLGNCLRQNWGILKHCTLLSCAFHLPWQEYVHVVQANLAANTVILNLKYISNICHKSDYRNVWYIEKMTDMSCLSKFVRQTLLLHCAYWQVKFGNDLMSSLNSLKPYKNQDMKENNRWSAPESCICDLNRITQECMCISILSAHLSLKQK